MELCYDAKVRPSRDPADTMVFAVKAKSLSAAIGAILANCPETPTSLTISLERREFLDAEAAGNAGV